MPKARPAPVARGKEAATDRVYCLLGSPASPSRPPQLLRCKFQLYPSFKHATGESPSLVTNFGNAVHFSIAIWRRRHVLLSSSRKCEARNGRRVGARNQPLITEYTPTAKTYGYPQVVYLLSGRTGVFPQVPCGSIPSPRRP